MSLILMFWTFGEIFLGFNTRVDPLPTCSGFLRFTSGATPAELLMASMAARFFLSTYLYIYIQPFVVLDPRIESAAQCAAQCAIHQCLCKLQISAPCTIGKLTFYEHASHKFLVIYGIKADSHKIVHKYIPISGKES